MAIKVVKSSKTEEHYDPKNLFTREGKRKYLTSEELDAFLAQANKQEGIVTLTHIWQTVRYEDSNDQLPTPSVPC